MSSLRFGVALAITVSLCGCDAPPDTDNMDGAGASDAGVERRDSAALPRRDSGSDVLDSGDMDAAAPGDAGAGDAGAGDAGAGDAGTIVPFPPGLGWTELTATRIQDVCPPEQADGTAGPYNFPFFCRNVTRAWGGAIADTSRGQMIIWNGGHNDYYGNELYRLDLNTRAMVRVTDPTIPTNRSNSANCAAALGSVPNARHTYGGLAYVAHADKMFAFGGSRSCESGSGGSDAWTLDLATLTWTRVSDGAPVTAANPLAAIIDYDPTSRLVYILDRANLVSYDIDTDTYTRLRSGLSHGLTTHGVIDPRRQLFITADADGLGIIDISTGSTYERARYARPTSCGTMSARNRGMAYDPNLDAIVIWSGGNNVDIFDPDTRTCTTMGGSGGPGSQEDRGTYGRFRYFPTHSVFAVVNRVADNAYILRLTE